MSFGAGMAFPVKRSALYVRLIDVYMPGGGVFISERESLPRRFQLSDRLELPEGYDVGQGHRKIFPQWHQMHELARRQNVS